MIDIEKKEPYVNLPVLLVADIQDSILVVVNDLKRLDSLLSQTMDNLLDRFSSVNNTISNPLLKEFEELENVRSILKSAVTELQFQDMSSQLIIHTSKILQGCAYRLASESMDNEDGPAIPFVADIPLRPNPVTQEEMNSGSIELF